DAGLGFFEQPVKADDIAGMATVAAAAGNIAIGADEGIHSLDDIRRHHERSAARGASLKAIKLGGMRAATEAGRLCDALGLNVNVSAKTGESSIACAAAMHIAAALPQIAWGLTLTNEGLGDDVTARPVRIARGHVELSDRPGLGIDVDEERVRRYRREGPVRQGAERRSPPRDRLGGLRMKQDQIRIGVVGAGRLGALRARLAAKHPAVRSRAIPARAPARARAPAAEAGADAHSGSNDEVISPPQATAVIVSTPEQQHTPPILKALELGKPVLVEKPIGFSLREADKILDTLRATKGELRVGYSRRYKECFLRAKEQMLRGRLGKVVGC